MKKFRYTVSDHKDTVKLVVCGHLHNPVSGNIDGVPVVTAPSTNWRAKYDIVPVENIVAEDKPLGFYVYRYEAGLLTSYLVPAHPFKECYKAVMFCVLLLRRICHNITFS